MNISVFGLGYVGTVTAACLAAEGHHVVGVDVNPDKVEAINRGCSPIVEPGLEELVRAAVQEGRLWATCDAATAVARGPLALVCVGTPSDANGNLDFQYVDRVCVEIARALRGTRDSGLVVLRCTLLPGTVGDRLLPLLEQESSREAGSGLGVAVNPEFLREGSAIADFRNPPFTLIGEMDRLDGDMVEMLYAGIPAPVVRTDPNTASMVKYASNAFHALKVVFANEVGRLCKGLGMDATEVMDIFCQDNHLNISTRYLRPGFAFGGSCLPKDLRALLYLARHNDVSLPVLESILPSNALHVREALDMILHDRRRNVGIVGLTFKPGTDDVRESPMVELVESLSGKGFQVRIYDECMSLPALVGSNKAFIERAIPHIAALMCPTLKEVVDSSDIIVVAHGSSNGARHLLDCLAPDKRVIALVKPQSSPAALVRDYEGICW